MDIEEIDFSSSRISEFSDLMWSIIRENKENFSDSTLEILDRVREMITVASFLAQEVEGLYTSKIGEENFRRSVVENLTVNGGMLRNSLDWIAEIKNDKE